MWHSYKKNLWSWHFWVYPTFGKHPNVKRPPHSPPNCGGLALALSSLTNSAQSSQSRPGLIGWAAIRVAFKKKHIFVGTIGFGAYRFFPCCCPIFGQSQKKRVAIDPETAGESFCARPYLYFACGPFKKPRQTNPCCRQWSCAHVSIVLPEFPFMGYSALRSKITSCFVVFRTEFSPFSADESHWDGCNVQYAEELPTALGGLRPEIISLTKPQALGCYWHQLQTPRFVYSRTTWDDWFVSKFGLK